MPKLLIVDDEPGIIQLLKDYFELQGYEILTALDGTSAIEKVTENPDLILLDVNLPDLDGFEVCSRIREHIVCPILFLTSKVEEQDRIQGLLLGGDDYILKPFSIEELDARVNAHLRREKRRQRNGSVQIFGNIAIHYEERIVYVNNQPIRLTKTEFDIVELLSLHKRQIFTREQIYERIRGYEGEGDSNIVMEHVRRIRLKLSESGQQEVIHTVWGVGYQWIG